MKAWILKSSACKSDINTSFAFATKATRDNPNPESVWHVSPNYAVLIEHPDAGYIMYDMGTPSDPENIWDASICNGCCYIPIEGETIEEQLQLLGLVPADINYVVISHMHMDHIGTIQAFKDTAVFYVSRAEAEYAFTTVMATTDRSKHGFYNRTDVLADMKELRYVEEDGEIFEGVEAILLPGHTAGTMGLILHMENKNLFIVSDAVVHRKNYEGWKPGTVYDTVNWEKSLNKIKKLEKKYNAQILFGHSEEGLKTIPDYFE